MSAPTEKKMAQSLPARSLAALLPAEGGGWKAAGQDRFADADSLFDLIDGGAEVYRALNVQAVVEREYQRPDHAMILVDLFDMGSDEDAFGAFRNDVRENPDPGIGNGAEHEGSALFFWKSRYFVAVVATEATPEAKAAVLALGKAIAGNIKQSGKPPRLLSLLPPAGLNQQEIYFFHNGESLNRLLSSAVGNPFALSRQTRALLARYGRGATGGEALLLLVEYADAASARAVAQRLEGAGALRYETLTTPIAALRARDRLLCAVLDTTDRAAAAALCAEALAAAGRKAR